jgi:prepilin-type N-terminal cleavage/methylation domain-containing protein
MKFQKGFSLVELVVTVGLMGVVSLLTMRIMENQSAAQLSVEVTAEINNTVSLISQAINDPRKCAQMFAGRNVNSTVDELSYQITSVTPPSTAYLLQTRNDGKIYRYFYVEDGDITLSQDTAMGMANLNIVFKVQSMSSAQKLNLFSMMNARTVRRQIPFNVVTDGSLNILACGPIASQGNLEAKRIACNSLARTGVTTWNAVTARCEISPKACPFGQLPVNFDAFGNIVCRQANTLIQVEDIFDLDHSTDCQPLTGGRVLSLWGITTNPSNGKLRLSCTRL